MKRRDKKAEESELETLLRLEGNADFQVYRHVLQRHIDVIRTFLHQNTLITPEEIAKHNAAVGEIRGLTTAITLSDALRRRFEFEAQRKMKQ